MVNGFAGQLLRLDLSGKVLAAVGKPVTGQASSAKRTSSPSARAAISTWPIRSTAC
jgi:hypothetical protein